MWWIYIYPYVCIFICIYVYTRTHTYIHIHPLCLGIVVLSLSLLWAQGLPYAFMTSPWQVQPVRIENVSKHWHLSPHKVKSILLESRLKEQFGSTLCSEHRRTRSEVDERGAVWGLVGQLLAWRVRTPSLLSFMLWLSPSFPPGDGLEPWAFTLKLMLQRRRHASWPS